MSIIISQNKTDSGDYTIGGTVTKDMSNDTYTYEFNPYTFQQDFFPGMADFINENIVQGDKDSNNRLIASYWDDLGNDVFDDWGYFYIYDIETGKYYFPLISPQNQGDGVFTTQIFNVFNRFYTIVHGWTVQGIFKFDITSSDNAPFRFGAYGNMGSDGDEFTQNLTYNYTLGDNNLTLYYHRHQEIGDVNEQLYSYFIPKKITENNSQSYNSYYNEDDMSIISKEVTYGLTVYFSKRNDVKQWVVYDLQLSEIPVNITFKYDLFLNLIKNNTKQTEDKLYDRFNYKKALTNYKVKI